MTVSLRRKIGAKLRQARWSPEQISGWLAEQDIALSHTRIYQLFRRDKRNSGDVWRRLRRRRKRDNWCAGNTASSGWILARTNIPERADIVVRRNRVGDREGETLISAGCKGALLKLLERKTKRMKIALLSRASAGFLRKAAARRRTPISKVVDTMTFEKGEEFAAHQDIATALDAKVFFATAYYARERGRNEITTDLISDCFPKTSDFTTVTAAGTARLEWLLNHDPRKSLDS